MAEIKPQIPRHAGEVTPTWLTQVLGFEVSDKNFSLVPNAQDGNGFLSSLLRVSCKSAKSKEKVNLIVKLLPEDEFMKQLVVTKELDKTEIECYKTVLPELIKLVPGLKEFICPFLYGNFGTQDGAYGSVLILRDLKPLQYFSLHFGQDETEAQLAEGIDFLAKLHFAGSLLERNQRSAITSLFNFINHHDQDESGMLVEMCKDGFAVLDQLFLESDDMLDTKTAYNSLVEQTGNIMNLIQIKCNEYPSLIHGDLWSGNILLTKDPTQHTKVIDWQLLGYKDPTVDIGVYIMSALPNELITKESLEKYLKMYYDGFLELCEENQAYDLIKRSWPQFLKFFNSYGLAYTMIWLIMSLESMVMRDRVKFIKIIDFFYRDMKIPEFINDELKKMGLGTTT